ncbi:MAG: hypothetical protein WA198_15905 [Candidatus Sulfotelmatobacter sp.]
MWVAASQFPAHKFEILGGDLEPFRLEDVVACSSGRSSFCTEASDPACGTCGFLVAVGESLRERHPEVMTNAKLRQHFHRDLFHGIDFDKLGALRAISTPCSSMFMLPIRSIVQPWRKGSRRDRVGDAYYSMGEVGRASEYLTKAFQLRGPGESGTDLSGMDCQLSTKPKAKFGSSSMAR